VDGTSNTDVNFHSVVQLSTKLSPVQAGVTVNFAVTDPDDPTTDDLIVDSTGPAGDDNRGTPKIGSVSAASAVTDSAGIARVWFTLSTYQFWGHNTYFLIR